MLNTVSAKQIQDASEVDLVQFLLQHGEQLKNCGLQFEWVRHSGKVIIAKNKWYDFYDQEGGYPIGFVKKYYGLDFPNAVRFLLGEPFSAEQKEFKLPEHNKNLTTVKKYLTDVRGIDPDILETFISEGLIYESKDYHNIVFVGKDKDGVPAHAHRRSATIKKKYVGTVPGSKADCSFSRIGTGDILYVFESPIDMLSYITMNKQEWFKQSYVACCGLSAAPIIRIIHDFPHIKTVFLCFDNDEAGQRATKKISDKLFINGVFAEVLVPTRKDWNEDLIVLRKEGVIQNE
jgi:hypothetical protein